MKENRYSNKRYWWGFLSIIPCSVLFVMGVLWSSEIIPIALHKYDYKSGEFRSYGARQLNSRGGTPSSRALIGTVGSVKTSLGIGINRSTPPDVYVPDTMRVKKEKVYDVWYRDDGEYTLHRTAQGFETDFNTVVWENSRIVLLLITPFILSFGLYLHYRQKEKQLQKAEVAS